MTAAPPLCFSVMPAPPTYDTEAVLDSLLGIFPLSDSMDYILEIAARPAPSHIKRERLHTLSLLPPLLRRLGYDPGVLTLARDEHGRPYLRHSSGQCLVDFNLSHTGGCVACAAIPAPARVGLDVQDILPPARTEKLIRRFCTAGERHMLAGEFPFPHKHLIPVREGFLPDFICLWVIREAVAKYIGKGQPLRFDAASPPSGVRLWVGHLPEANARIALCFSGTEDTPMESVESHESLSLIPDFDLWIP